MVRVARPSAGGVVTAPCVHHWRLEEPHGPTVAGVCQHCGEVRDFRTAEPEPAPLGQQDHAVLDARRRPRIVGPSR